MADSKRPDAPGRSRPMAESGQERSAGDVGGIASTADGGLQDALQRRSERRDDDPTGATVGSASAGGAGPRIDLGGKSEPGSAPGAPAPDRLSPGSPRAGHAGVRPGTAGSSSATAGSSPPSGSLSGSGEVRGGVARNADEPPDEGPVESLGRAVSEVVTGPIQDRDEHEPATPPRRR